MDRAGTSLASHPLICLVTDRGVLADAAGDETRAGNELLDVIADCADAGVDLVQIREPGLSDRCLLELVRAAMDRTRATPARILVNDRPDVALAAGAAGVHLKDDERSATRVRTLGPHDWIVGRSVHGVAAARRAAESGAVDYLLAGTVFRSVSKPGRQPLGIEALRDIVHAFRPAGSGDRRGGAGRRGGGGGGRRGGRGRYPALSVRGDSGTAGPDRDAGAGVAGRV